MLISPGRSKINFSLSAGLGVVGDYHFAFFCDVSCNWCFGRFFFTLETSFRRRGCAFCWWEEGVHSSSLPYLVVTDLSGVGGLGWAFVLFFVFLIPGEGTQVGQSVLSVRQKAQTRPAANGILRTMKSHTICVSPLFSPVCMYVGRLLPPRPVVTNVSCSHSEERLGRCFETVDYPVGSSNERPLCHSNEEVTQTKNIFPTLSPLLQVGRFFA